MSAIWGAIDLGKNEIPESYVEIFHDAYKECVIDKTEIYRKGNVLMGCEIQYFTPQSIGEKLPCENDKYCFVADVYLDNREELLEDSVFEGKDRKSIPDGEILFTWYTTYGKDKLKEAKGSYCFVIYDKSTENVQLVMDHMANRCLYYAVVGEVFFFSTLMEPIWKINQNIMHGNKKVLADYLAIEDRRVYLDYKQTIIEEIYHGVSGEILTVSKNVKSSAEYWNPRKLLGKYKGKTDEQYKAEFLASFEKVVRQAMRTDANVGILLSGGLDSTAVACMATKALKEKKQDLFAYTLVPVEDYVDDTHQWTNVNERELVEKSAEYWENVATHFESMPDINAWDCREEEAKITEGPFKSLQNVMMLRELGRKARAVGCRILLNGQLGNDTISYGNSGAYLYEEFVKFHWLRLWREINTHSAYFRYNKKKVLKQIWEQFKQTPETKPQTYEEFMSHTVLKEYTKAEFKKLMSSAPVRTRKDYLVYVLDKMRFRQIGDNETRISLYSGVICKDPTRNVEFMEFCLSLPTEQFQKGCTNRRLVYEYMKDIYPPHMLDQRLPKGRQSADFFYRLRNKKKEMIAAIEEMLMEENSLMDIKKMREFWKEQKNIFEKQELLDEDKSVLEYWLYVLQAADLMKQYNFF